jgi:hypothetical protein
MIGPYISQRTWRGHVSDRRFPLAFASRRGDTANGLRQLAGKKRTTRRSENRETSGSRTLTRLGDGDTTYCRLPYSLVPCNDSDSSLFLAIFPNSQLSCRTTCLIQIRSKPAFRPPSLEGDPRSAVQRVELPFVLSIDLPIERIRRSRQTHFGDETSQPWGVPI